MVLDYLRDVDQMQASYLMEIQPVLLLLPREDALIFPLAGHKKGSWM